MNTKMIEFLNKNKKNILQRKDKSHTTIVLHRDYTFLACLHIEEHCWCLENDRDIFCGEGQPPQSILTKFMDCLN